MQTEFDFFNLYLNTTQLANIAAQTDLYQARSTATSVDCQLAALADGGSEGDEEDSDS